MTAIAASGEQGLVTNAGTGSPNLLLRALRADPVAPDAPTGVASTPGVASADLTWTAPANDGGAVVTGYAIYYLTDDGVSYTTVSANTGSTATTRTVASLSSSSTYRFAVAAVNSVGTSVKSSLSAAVTPVAAAVPVAPPSGGGTGGGSAPSTGSGGGGGSDWLVTEVRPSSGPTAGGTRALVIGYGLWGATSVIIGGVPVQSFKNIDGGTIEIITPPGKVGWQDLRVMLPNGSAPAGFQYVEGAANTPTAGTTTAAALVQAGSPATTPTTVSAKPSVLIARPGQRVTLTVVVRSNGAPVSGARVSLNAKGKTVRAVTDATGTAMLKVNPRATTRYTVNVAETASSAASQSSTVVKVRATKRHHPAG
jgi:hypothetical protein